MNLLNAFATFSIISFSMTSVVVGSHSNYLDSQSPFLQHNEVANAMSFMYADSPNFNQNPYYQQRSSSLISPSTQNAQLLPGILPNTPAAKSSVPQPPQIDNDQQDDDVLTLQNSAVTVITNPSKSYSTMAVGVSILSTKYSGGGSENPIAVLSSGDQQSRILNIKQENPPLDPNTGRTSATTLATHGRFVAGRGAAMSIEIPDTPVAQSQIDADILASFGAGAKSEMSSDNALSNYREQKVETYTYETPAEKQRRIAELENESLRIHLMSAFYGAIVTFIVFFVGVFVYEFSRYCVRQRRINALHKQAMMDQQVRQTVPLVSRDSIVQQE